MRTDSTGTDWWSDFWKGVGNWFENHWVEVLVGTAFIVAGAVVTFFSAGMGTAGLLAAGGALLASAKAVGISMVVSAGIGTVVGGITEGREGAVNGFSDGLASGYMWGGIFSGGAQLLSAAMKLTRYLTPDFNGSRIGKLKVLSPNSADNPNIGGTLIKFGGYNRIDVEVGRGLHLALRIFGKKINHIPLGIILSSVLGVFFK